LDFNNPFHPVNLLKSPFRQRIKKDEQRKKVERSVANAASSGNKSWQTKKIKKQWKQISSNGEN
jgi:hypothetical protein